MDPEIEKAEREFEAASKQMRKCLTLNHGGGKAEKSYADAYQALVRVGARPQIRKKYRAP